MKEFDKWWKNQCKENLGKPIGRSPRFFAEEGWKAALEWAISQRVGGWEEDGTISYSNCIHVTDMEDELNVS